MASGFALSCAWCHTVDLLFLVGLLVGSSRRIPLIYVSLLDRRLLYGILATSSQMVLLWRVSRSSTWIFGPSEWLAPTLWRVGGKLLWCPEDLLPLDQAQHPWLMGLRAFTTGAWADSLW